MNLLDYILGLIDGNGDIFDLVRFPEVVEMDNAELVLSPLKIHIEVYLLLDTVMIKNTNRLVFLQKHQLLYLKLSLLCEINRVLEVDSYNTKRAYRFRLCQAFTFLNFICIICP